MNILIVDDSPMIHMMLKKSLEKLGHVICGDAKNGKEAIEMYKKLNPDLVFMDITMPVMEGLPAAEEIKKINSGSKIIMLSAMGDDEVTSQAKNIGVNLFLKKPFNDTMISDALNNIK